jgi:uncharacterized protein (TIGR02246 family)
MKQTILITLLAIAFSVSAFAKTVQTRNDGSVEQTIRQLENENREATLKNDASVFERLLADDWLNTNANGTVTTKAQLMTLLKSGTFKISSLEYDDVVVRAYKDTAVVTGRSTSTRMGQDNKLITGQVRFTRVYVKRDSGWQVVSAQSTPIPRT